MQLTDIEKKLIVLALDPAAGSGEIEVAAVKWVTYLRKRYTDGHELLKDLSGVPDRPIREETQNRYGDFEFPFGKYKGRRLRDMPVSYLVWALAECDLHPPTKLAVEAWLGVRGRPGGPAPSPKNPYWE